MEPSEREKSTLLRARYVVPLNPALPDVIHDGVVAVERGQILAVGAASDFKSDGPFEDLGDVWLLPGFVNAHTHLELSCYAGQLPPGPFWSWIERLIELRRQPGAAEREARAVADGARLSLQAGV